MLNFLTAAKAAVVKNWQTSGSAFIAALAGLIATQPDLFDLAMDDKIVKVAKWIMAGGLVAFGVAAKQHNVTGGTVPATDEAKERTEGEK